MLKVKKDKRHAINHFYRTFEIRFGSPPKIIMAPSSFQNPLCITIKGLKQRY